MFNTQSGGFVVCHTSHNAQYVHEFTMAEAFAKDGKKVKLLSESAPIGVKTPDAEIIGEGIFDFKNINTTNLSNIEKNIHDYVLNAKKQADNIAFNLADNPVVTVDVVNKAVNDAILTSRAAGLGGIADKVGVVYRNGATKIINLSEFNIANEVKF